MLQRGTIQKIRNSKSFKGLCVFMAFNILAQIIAPLQALALTGGPGQPESKSFTAIGTTDMVDLASGDMNYNIPLMDIGGYPINLAYSPNTGMDEQASWVGLGWNISIGQINHNVRGIPDDFNGDEIVYEDNLKKNITVSGSFKYTPNVFGADLPKLPTNTGSAATNRSNAGSNNDKGGPVSYGVTATYNSYTGFSLKPNIGVGVNIGSHVSIGFNVESTEDGLNLSPSVSFSAHTKSKTDKNFKLGSTIGCSFNSRQGLSNATIQGSIQKSSIQTINGQKKNVGVGETGSVGSSIGFTDATYVPTVRNGLVTNTFTITAALGSEFFGGEGQGQITAFGTVQSLKETERSIPSYGYPHTDNANKKSNIDLNREKDGAVSKNSTNLAISNYTYDIHSVQGQGVSGMYRPYRNQVGYVFETYSEDASNSATLGLEFGVGNAVHNAFDVGTTIARGNSGPWEARIVGKFKKGANPAADYEHVYYKNVGDLSVDQQFTSAESGYGPTQLFTRVGEYEAVAIPFVGKPFRRALTEKYALKGQHPLHASLPVNSKIVKTKRQARNQSILNLTVDEVKSGVGYGPVVAKEAELPDEAKGHHIAEIQITRNDGARYIYGLPAYNLKKEETTFAVENGKNGTAKVADGLFKYNNSFADIINNKSFKDLSYDKFYNKTTTPAYVHTHLLTSVLSADYQDIDDIPGPSEGDLGSYTKFTYDKKAKRYNWRSPLGENTASYNEGLRSDETDDQASFIYGEKELYYISKIETKTHVAIFNVSNTHRQDGEGVLGRHGGINSNSNTYALESISLFAKPDFEKGSTTPIKKVNFVYENKLCVNSETKIGKLTLSRLFFTYKSSKMGKYTDYEFDYHATNALENPNYSIKGYDCWGNYKPDYKSFSVYGAPTNAEFPYVDQDKAKQDIHAAVWSLKEIFLPSGGSIKIEYESDDYNYVQDKKAMRMFTVAGAGNFAEPLSTNGSLINPNSQVDELFEIGHISTKYYFYVEIPKDIHDQVELKLNKQKQEYINSLFFQGLDRDLIQFRFFLNMTKLGGYSANAPDAKYDFVSGYAERDTQKNSEAFEDNGKFYLSVPVKLVDRDNKPGGHLARYNPVSRAGWQFGRKQLKNQVYSVLENGDPALNSAEGVTMNIVKQLFQVNTIANLFEILTGPNLRLANNGIARRFVKSKSFIRLNEPTGKKLGGGHRVKSVRMNDVWEKMNTPQGATSAPAGYKTMNYGQEYNYTLDGTISSGVATYEPIGCKENPLIQPVAGEGTRVKLFLAPDDVNYVEKPFGECYFPSPQVTYSKVTVNNLAAGVIPDGKQVKKLHQTGSVVTEFYTTNDYPTLVDQTELQAKNDDTGMLGSLLAVFSKKSFIGSQGYVIHLNDMNGKQKSQRIYAANQKDAISGVDYIYDTYEENGGGVSAKNTNGNRGRLDNRVKVIYPNGEIKTNTIGVEYDVINDFRENNSNTTTSGLAFNTGSFLAGVIPILVPLPIPKFNRSEERFKSVTTTKVINTFGILKETKAYDGGSSVSTRNLAWDAITGEILLTETVDEYNERYYTFNYPAHWVYEGMAGAYQNIGFTSDVTEQSAGTYKLSSGSANNYLIPGDQVTASLTNSSNGNSIINAWVSEVNGDQFKLIDQLGNTIPASKSIKVFRSGHRNLQAAGIMNVTLMHNPLMTTWNTPADRLNSTFLESKSWQKYRIVNAGAVEYTDKWPGTCECLNGVAATSTNPYFKNEKGVWRTISSWTYLGGRNYQTAKTTGRREGFFTAFSPFYQLTASNKWYKEYQGWTFVSRVSKFSPYGFELENKDALNRYSAAQYGYSNKFPIAVGANLKYSEIGFDGFEDYDFKGCDVNSHFDFRTARKNNSTVVGVNSLNNGVLIDKKTAHSGKSSINVGVGQKASITKKIKCN